jgi:dinuclear metal center YbgI/SA1388 family protein
MKTCTLDEFLQALEQLAPPEGAAEWDNTGLLLQGNAPTISKVLVTLDLTPAVAAEAVRKSCDAVVSYHPPIFSGLTEVTDADPMQAGLLSLLRAGCHVYSPHTALDAAEGGVSDWLAACFAAKEIEPHEGSARIITLRSALSLEHLTHAWSDYLKCPYLRVSRPAGRSRNVKRLALCPGAGASALTGLKVDAVFTGEMKHHDILAWQRAGTAVILAEHGHTERPYLAMFRKHLAAALGGVTVIAARKDKEPLELVLPHA